MKSMILVSLALVAAVAAAPPHEAQVVRSDVQQQPDGTYQFNFETDQGIVRQENGDLKEVRDEENKPVVVLTVRGSYSYVNDEGKPETIQYYADETGYHADGPSIPQSPPARR